jgi:hypothetical protein
MQWQIGKVTVTKIVELEVTGGSRFILPQATYEEILPIEWMQPHFADERGRLKMSIHALVVETPDRRIVVDTCLGNDKQGWNTMLVDGKWLPTFPRARYLMGRVEFAHWQEQHERDDMAAVFADSVKPVHDAGLADLVETDHRVCDEISLVPTTGHTPGHVSVLIRSEGEEALITGDFIHHPCQIAHPEWSSTADTDPEAAHRTRDCMLKELSERPVLVIGTHFAGATAGRIVRDGDTYRLAV